jgi:phosphohistidine phosphatase
MKRLYILRHAHTEPQGLGLADFDRALDQQGREEAEVLGKYLDQTKQTYDFIMCSAALRCQETLEPLRRFSITGKIEISENYYNISEDEILEYLRQAPDDAESLLYIGHNPGVVFTILKLVRTIPDFLKEGLKPATLIGIQVPIDKWSDLVWHDGDIIDSYHPNLDAGDTPEPMKS